MKTIELLQNRLKELEAEVFEVLKNQTISMTQKNIIMQPIVDEKKAILKCISELNSIKNKSYVGKCVY